MPFPDIDPIAFSLGPLVVRWYSLGYLFGIVLGIIYGRSLLKRTSLWHNNKAPFTPDQFIDFGMWAVLGAIIGGRLGYVVFYDPLYFMANPLHIFQTWLGGMSFHGGLIGVVVAMYFFGRHKKANFLSSLDLLAAVSTIGIFLVRITNFINGELYGRPTDLPWGVIFPSTNGVPHHPTQLYEAMLEGLLLFIIIRFVTHMRFGLRKPGLAAGIFGVGYALSRLLVEQVRLPDAHIGYLFNTDWVTQGMMLTLPILALGIVLIAKATKTPNADY
ncbi:MAG TPA: prolipoprotein diacylglyceryl transferase [Devosia sp.]|nr:prolipoprotein diacylglyceryl transferase [Devosia sp.]